MSVRFALAATARKEYRRVLRQAIRRGAQRVCEVGAGANPSVSLRTIGKKSLDYKLLDVSESELLKAPAGYKTVCMDIEDPALELDGAYDLVCSKMTAEHVRAPAIFHRNILRLLRPGGEAVHLFSTLYSPPFVMNRVMPEAWSERFLVRLQPMRTSEGRHAKFPAYYRWCRGPTHFQLARLRKAGFEVDEYVGYFGHSGSATSGVGYYDRIPRLRLIHEKICSGLLRLPIAALTSLALVRLRKPMLSNGGFRAA